MFCTMAESFARAIRASPLNWRSAATTGLRSRIEMGTRRKLLTFDIMVEAKTVRTPREHDPVLTAFDAFERAGHGTTPSWLQALHKGGIAHFVELGFPTTKHEEWRFTNVAPIAKTDWQLAEGGARLKESDVARLVFPGASGRRLVFIDGRFSKELSSKESAAANSLRTMSLYEAMRSTFPLVTHSLARYARYDDNPF